MNFYCIPLFTLFLSLPYLANAQNIRAGLIAGVTGTQVDGDQLSGYNKLGLNFGGISNLKLSDEFSAQFEILYVQKGARTPIDSTGTLPYYRLRLQYIEVPVSALYHYKLKKTRGTIEAGLSYGTLLKAVEESAYYAPYAGVGFFKNDISAHAGLGFFIGKIMMAHFRYSISTMPIRTGPSGGKRSILTRGQYNNLLLFSVRIYFKSFES